MLVPLDHSIAAVMFARQALCIEFADGRSVCAPLEWFPALLAARPDERDRWKLAADRHSVEWPDLGETVTSAFLLAKR